MLIYELYNSHGHLAVPSNHCQYNSAEHMRATIKNYNKQNIGPNGFGDEVVKEMWREVEQLHLTHDNIFLQ